MKIIHIASDEKFINSAYSQFEELYPGANLFYILVDDISSSLKYVEKKGSMVLMANEISLLKKLSGKFVDADLICFHGLSYFSSIVLNRTPLKYKVLWFLWGTEVHNNPRLFNQQRNIGSDTYKSYVEKNSTEKFKNTIKNLFRGTLYRLRNRTSSPFSEITKSIKRADYCGLLYREEFDLIKREINSNLKYIKFCYYPIERMLRNPENWVIGNNILLGNSGSYTNNHLEAFAIVKEFDLSGIKVVTPLSYGNETYITKTIEAGKNELGDSFEPLIDFMPLHVYNNYIQQCGIVVMNHYRQQAVGNILVMLWMGAKVYLNESNTAYHYFKRIGAHVFSVSQELNKNNPDALRCLTKEQQLHNRQLLNSHVGQEVLLKELKIHLDEIV